LAHFTIKVNFTQIYFEVYTSAGACHICRWKKARLPSPSRLPREYGGQVSVASSLRSRYGGEGASDGRDGGQAFRIGKTCKLATVWQRQFACRIADWRWLFALKGG